MLARIGADRAEKEPCKVCLLSAYRSPRLTTVGYGDIAPQNHTEHSYAVVIMLISGFFWAWVLGTFCNITVSLNETGTFYKQACDKMNLMIRDEGMSADLARSLRLYMRRARHVLGAVRLTRTGGRSVSMGAKLSTALSRLYRRRSQRNTAEFVLDIYHSCTAEISKR